VCVCEQRRLKDCTSVYTRAPVGLVSLIGYLTFLLVSLFGCQSTVFAEALRIVFLTSFLMFRKPKSRQSVLTILHYDRVVPAYLCIASQISLPIPALTLLRAVWYDCDIVNNVQLRSHGPHEPNRRRSPRSIPRD
jgi:hypothetical protein